MMRVILTILITVGGCLGFTAASIRAQAGPPLLTDDPETPGNRHWEINLAMTLSQTPESRLFGIPLLDVNYGLGERLQLKAEVPWLVLQDRHGGATRSGFGSTNLGVKWRFIDQEKRGFAMSTYPQVEFRTSASSVKKGLIEGGAELRLPVEISREFGKTALVSELAYQIVQREHDEWIYGFAVEHKISKRLEVLGELHGESQRGLAANEVIFNMGGRYEMTPRYTLLFSSGRTFGHASAERPSWIAYTGLQLHF